MFPIRNGLKHGDVLSPYLSIFAPEYAIRRVQVNQDGLKYKLLFYAEPNIVEDIKIRKLEWAGHIIRMEEGFQKKVLNGNFYTTRQVGRPRSRWADVVQRDALQLLGIRDGGEELQIEINGGVL
jgi:hypothetical protein